ncbi:MAG: OmpA family protein [Steroidobacteraceae bacterium]
MKRFIAAGGMVLFATAAFAADDQWYLAPQIGGTFTDSERKVDDALFYGLAIGKHLNDRWALEFNALGGSHDGKSGMPDLDISALSVDLLRSFNSGGRVSPYFTAGLGVLRDDPSPGKGSNDFLTQAGLGLAIHAWQSASGSSAFNIRPQVKLRWDDTGRAGHLQDVLAGIGFEFAFGGSAAPVAAPVAVVAPAPAPAPAPVVASPPPAPQPVDSDGDGVLDNVDRCPGTPRGTAVDAYGCPRKGSITLVGVNFATNSAQLLPESLGVLNTVATDLKTYPRLKVELQGHTDSAGSDAYNLKLSQSRAEAVRDYLVSQGVSAGQLSAKGYGESRPVAANTTAAGRAENRRVVMDVLDNPGDVQIKKGEGAE